MGGRGSGGSKNGGGTASKTIETAKPEVKIKKGTPFLKNLNDYQESKALKEKHSEILKNYKNGQIGTEIKN